MTESLKNIPNELEQIVTAARAAKDSIQGITEAINQLQTSIASRQKSLVEMVQGAAGFATGPLSPAALSRIEQLIQKAGAGEQYPQRMRLTEGKYLPYSGTFHQELEKQAQELRAYVDEFTKLTEELDQLKAKAVSTAVQTVPGTQEDLKRSIEQSGLAINPKRFVNEQDVKAAEKELERLKTLGESIYGEYERMGGVSIFGGAGLNKRAPDIYSNPELARQSTAQGERDQANFDRQLQEHLDFRRQAQEEAAREESTLNRQRQREAQEILRAQQQAEKEASRQTTRNAKEQAKAQQDAANQATRIQEAQSILSGRGAAGTKVDETLRRYNMTMGDLSKVTTEGSTQISKMSFVARQADGVFKTLTLTVDKFGNVLVDRQNRFRGFFESIGRNFIEGLKWTVAIGAIYGPLNKLQEMVQLAVKNEAELANIGIILGKSQGALGSIFDNAARAAQATGEHLDGVLEGYTLAYRATGKYADENVRAQKANQLLVDSLILSKMSGMEQATALDTLVGALNQMGMELDQGGVLLNKWVAVSKRANVDVKTLAESFAITSTAATNAGISIDEINGIIATVAENTTLSATEAGNAVRAFISGFQTDTARKELQKFGIAVEDAEGNARGFMDVMYQIASMKNAGIITDSQMGKIAEVLGGGARRGAQYAALLENLGRVQQVAAVSANAQNDAYDAMSLKLDTVQTSITLVGNSFQELAQAMGMEGGILGTFKLVLEVIDGIISGLTTLTKSLGAALPLLATAGAAIGYLNTKGQLNPALQNMGGWLVANSSILTAKNKQGMSAQELSTGLYQASAGRGLTSEASQTSFAQGFTQKAPLIGGLMAVGLMAGINASKKDWAGAGGNIGGAAIGALITGGNPIGMVIGSAIGEIFVDSILKRQGEFADIFRVKTSGADITEGMSEAEKEITKLQNKSRDILYKTAGGEAQVNIMNYASNLSATLGKFLFPNKYTSEITGLTPDQTAYRMMQMRAQGLVISSSGQQKTTPQQMAAANAALKEYWDIRTKIQELEDKAAGKAPKVAPGPFSDEVAKNSKANATLLKQLLSDYSQSLKDSLAKGEITAKQYNDSIDTIVKTNGVLVDEVFTALKENFTNAADGYKYLTDVISSSSPEQIENIAQLVTRIDELTTKLNELRNVGRAGGAPAEIGTIAAELASTRAQLNAVIAGQYTQNRKQQLKMPSIVDFGTLTKDQFQMVVNLASQIDTTKIQEAIKDGFLPSDATVDEVKSTYERLFVEIANGAFEPLSNVTQESLRDALEKLKEEGKIVEAGAFNITNVDANREQFLAQYEKTKQFITTSFPQYKLDEKEMGVIFKDNVTDTLHLDNLIMQMALQELVEVNRKQLDGIYNLPSGASFYVPLQAYEMHAATQAALAATQAMNEQPKKEGEQTPLDKLISLIEQFSKLISHGGTPTSLIDKVLEQINGLLKENPDLAGELEKALPTLTSQLGEAFASAALQIINPVEWEKNANAKANAGLSTEDLQKKLSTATTPGELDKVMAEIDKAVGGDSTQKLLMISEAQLSALNQLRDTLGSGVASIVQAVTNLGTLPATTTTNPTGAETQVASTALTKGVESTINFNLNMQSNTQLIVDGRVLADVIKQYLYADTQRAEGSSSTVSASVI